MSKVGPRENLMAARNYLKVYEMTDRENQPIVDDYLDSSERPMLPDAGSQSSEAANNLKKLKINKLFVTAAVEY